MRRPASFRGPAHRRSVGELFGRELDVDIEGIGVVDTVDHDLVVGGVTFFEQNGFDLAREDIDTADDHHVIAASHGLGHPDKGPAAGAFLTGEDADILGAVAQERETFFIEGGEDQFALFAVRERFASLGIDDLDIEMVLIDMHAFLFHIRRQHRPEISVRPQMP